MRAHSLAVVALMAVAATPPAVAGVVYAPAANFTQDGLQRRSELVLSNAPHQPESIVISTFPHCINSPISSNRSSISPTTIDSPGNWLAVTLIVLPENR